MPKAMFCAIVIICFIMGAAFAQSESGVIRGFIVDGTSDEVLPGASVVVAGMPRGAAANLDGYFVIDNLRPAVYNLEVSYLGYHIKQEQVVVTPVLMDPIKIELIPKGIELEEVTVYVEEKDEEKIRMSPTVSTVPVQVTTLRRLPSLGAEMDVLRTMQMVPGVKASSDINSALYVRGGSPDQTLILMDHNPVYNPSHLFGLFSTFNADAVKRIELMKGGFPAEYGGRSGSVLEVITNEGNRKEMEGMFSLGIVSARAALEGPLPQKKGSYAASFRRTYFDPLLAALRKATGDDYPDYYFYDGNGKLNYDISNKTTLSIAGYWGNDKMLVETGPEDNRSEFGLEWGNRTLTTRLRHVLSRNLFLSVGAAVSNYQSTWYFENSGVKLEDSIDRLYDYSGKVDLEYMGGLKHRIKAGLWVSRYRLTLRVRENEVPFVDIDPRVHNYSFYLQDSWRISPLFELRPGMRFYYHDAGDYLKVDPRLALVYYYDRNQRFKIAGGRYSQFIHVISFGEGFSSFDIWTPVDESIDPSYSDQIVLGYEWEPKEDLEFTCETYYTDMHNVANFDYLADRSDEAADAFVLGKGYAYGAEWMLRKTNGRLSGWLGYSLSWTKRQYTDTFVNRGNWYYPKWDRRHDFIIVGYYELNKRWDLSGSWRYNTGQSFTQPIGVTTYRFADVPLDYEGNDGRAILNGAKNNYRFPADHRLDLTSSYKHKFFGYDARLNFSVYNVYSRRSYWGRWADTSENPVKVQDLKLLPILPMFSYEVRF